MSRIHMPPLGHTLPRLRDAAADALRTGTAYTLRHPQVVGGVAAVAVAGVAIGAFLRWRNRPAAEELERRRRTALAGTGRLTDGTITDALTIDGDSDYSAAPEVLVYRYRLHGVVYDCAQDVRALAAEVNGCQIEQPVQVRYDPRHPGNSIIVSEAWSGLRLQPATTRKPAPELLQTPSH